MSKGIKIGSIVLAMFFGLSLFQVWLNIGFDKFSWRRTGDPEASFRVGYLPVT
jgi:hypothetical protein